MSKKQKFPKEAELNKMRKLLATGSAAKPLAKKSNPVDKLKHSLCAEFVKYKNKLTQKQMSIYLKIDEALISKIVNYAFEEFTVDRLIKHLSVLYPNIDIQLLLGKAA